MSDPRDQHFRLVTIKVVQKPPAAQTVELSLRNDTKETFEHLLGHALRFRSAEKEKRNKLEHEWQRRNDTYIWGESV